MLPVGLAATTHHEQVPAAGRDVVGRAAVWSDPLVAALPRSQQERTRATEREDRDHGLLAETQLPVPVERDAVATVAVPREAAAVEADAVARLQLPLRVDERRVGERPPAEPARKTGFLDPTFVAPESRRLKVDRVDEGAVDGVGVGQEAARDVDPR